MLLPVFLTADPAPPVVRAHDERRLVRIEAREGDPAPERWYIQVYDAEIAETIESARKIMARGIKGVRLQVAVPGYAAYGAAGQRRPDAGDPIFDPYAYVRRTLQLFEAARKELGPEVHLLHDVHERVPPRLAP